MINLEFLDQYGMRVKIEYEVHPRSQEKAIRIPKNATDIIVWLGTTVGKKTKRGV